MDENKMNFNSNGNDDDFIIGKGFALDENEEFLKDKKKRKKKKGHSAIKSIIWIVSIIVVSIGLAFGIIYAGADFTGLGFGRGEDCEMQIEMGTPAAVIAEKLEETGNVLCVFNNSADSAGGNGRKGKDNGERNYHNNRLHKVGSTFSKESAEESINNYKNSTDYHHRNIGKTEKGGKKFSAGYKAASRIYGKENKNKNRSDDKKRFFAVRFVEAF